MAIRAPESVDLDGLAPTYHAASGGGDKVSRAGDDVALHVVNGSGVSVTVTITTPGSVSGHAIADRAVAVPAGEDRFIGPLTAAVFANADQQVDLAWSATTSVTFAVLTV